MAEFLASWVQLLVPQPCFDEFFVDFNFLHVECLKVVISKCLGYSIILGSVMVKVPQIMKIISSKSGEGISMMSVSLEMAAITASLAYGYAQNFPFSAYGESVFLVIQTLAIAALVLLYAGNMTGCALYMGIYALILSFLMSPAAHPSLLWGLQASVPVNIVFARMIQAYQNYSNGSTGQLSLVTFLLLFFGALARVFTSIQETGDNIIILTYAISSFCSGIIVFQIFYYANSKPKSKAE